MGSGFSPEALKHATEQFYMDEQSRHSKSHYGIGLYVADSCNKEDNFTFSRRKGKFSFAFVMSISVSI